MNVAVDEEHRMIADPARRFVAHERSPRARNLPGTRG